MAESREREQEEVDGRGAGRPMGLNLASGRAGSKPSNSLGGGDNTPQGGSRMPPFLRELLANRRPRVSSNSKSQEPATPSSELSIDYPEREDAQVLKTGNLQKTSQSRGSATEAGPTRQRRFRLTAESLEYFQLFSQVKIRRSYPLTSLEEIVYPVADDRQVFQLVFATYLMTLRSESESDAEEWVEEIRKAWEQWQLPTPADSEQRGLASPLTPPTTLHTIAEVEERESEAGTPMVDRHAAPSQSPNKHPPLAISVAPAAPPPLLTGSSLELEDRPRSNTHSGILRRESTEVEFPTYDKRRQNKMRAQRIRKVARLAPRLEKQQHRVDEHHTSDKEAPSSKRLHQEYAMIKYPRKRWSIPSEKIFKIDKDNLMVIWRRNEGSKHKLRSSLSLHRVLEIRKGQLTEKFDRFPYDEVEDQSFSLIFEEVTKRYVRLTSLDLICDSHENCQEWIFGLQEKTNHLSSSIFPSEQYENTDPTMLWLKQFWAVEQSDHEMSQKDATTMVTTFRPGVLSAKCKQILSDSHHHQFRHTYHHGNALRWDGFVLMFNMICGHGGRLGTLFRRYAVKYPRLGMTEEELRTFLIQESHWPESRCTPNDIQVLISHHDYHHRAYKKYVARGVPLDYQIGSNLFSYAGFLSFLRSKANSAINLEHTNIYQDMTEPLSHYFINSSHNTYLEADQLYGKSSTDAYIRVLLQGCRCIEIDCWDDSRLNVTGVSEPIIYHGFTLTTKLPFREVIQTIKEYAFSASHSPLIISIENHCSSAQQTKMAKIFHAVMGEFLPKENLCEKEGRERLPSPHELQGKIILKGSSKAGGKRAPRPDPQQSVTASYMYLQQPEESLLPTSSLPTSPVTKEPLETTAVSLLQAKQQLPSRRSLKLKRGSSSYRARQNLKESVHSLEQSGQLNATVYQDDDQELIFAETAGDMKSLIVYCRAISIKPWSFHRQAQTSVSNMFSFGEPSALRRCYKYPIEMLACTERQLVRTYPRGTRFDSSNYPALTMWQCGVQMVALNFQYPDVYMHLNQGLFRSNGGCGYVLKPAVMRRPNNVEGQTNFDPRMTQPHPEVTPVNLEIELLSGQRLSFWKKKCLSCSVDIYTYGIPHDTGEMGTASSTDLFWPQWEEGKHVYVKRVLMPELCLVYLRVEVTSGRAAARKTTLYGQNCIPLVSLMPGIKFIPLRTPGGELIPESGVFLRIQKREEGGVAGGEEMSLRNETRRRLSHQEKVFEESGEFGIAVNSEIDVTQSIFPSRSKLLQKQMQKAHTLTDDDWGSAEQGGSVGGGLREERSLTSPPLLTSHGATSSPRETDEGEERANGQQQIQVVAEVHEETDSAQLSRSPHRSPVRQVYTPEGPAQPDDGTASVSEGQKMRSLTIQPMEPSTGAAESAGGGVGTNKKKREGRVVEGRSVRLTYQHNENVDMIVELSSDEDDFV